MKLDYKIINKDYYDIDAYSVFVEVTNKEQPSTVTYIELVYGIKDTNLKVDVSEGDDLYDDGSNLEAVDASDEVVEFYDFFICNEDLEQMHDEEKWDKQLYDSIMSETAKLLGGTVEEFKEAIYNVSQEVSKAVIKDLEEYFKIHYDRIPGVVFEHDEPEPDYDDWYNDYWD